MRSRFVPKRSTLIATMTLIGAIFVHVQTALASENQKAGSKDALSVLLVGNSHLLMPGFTKRLMRSLKTQAGGKRAVSLKVVAKIGTTLTKSRKKSSTLAAMRAKTWDVIVLQESTTAFMTNHGRKNFLAAVAWFHKNKPAASKLLLWQAWPQGSSHALYYRRGVWGRWFKNPPKNPNQLFTWISAGAKRAADANDVFISPIGHCWMSLPKRKRPYAGDDYHPSGRGLTFIAETLASSVVATSAGQSGDDKRLIGTCPTARKKK